MMCWKIETTGPDGEGLEPVRSLWIGSRLPEAQRACVASFIRVGHPFELFAYDHVEGVPAGTRLRDADEIVPRERIFRYGAAAGRGAGGLGGFSNLFRYSLLLRLGGYWVDTDNFCLRPLPTDDLVISSERGRDRSTIPNCGVLKCPAGSAFAAYCLGRANAADSSKLVFGQTGPALIGEAVRAFGAHASVAAPEVFCCVDWFNCRTLIESGTLPPEAVSVHLWGEVWRRNSGEVPWPGPRGSVLHDLSETGAIAGHAV